MRITPLRAQTLFRMMQEEKRRDSRFGVIYNIPKMGAFICRISRMQRKMTPRALIGRLYILKSRRESYVYR
jgi:hypothetical protein